MAQRRRTGLENQDLPTCHVYAFVMWIQSANSHTGQQPCAAQQAGQMAAIDLPPAQLFRLRSKGRPQMANVDAPLVKEILHIAEGQGVLHVHHHHEPDHLG